VLKNHWTMNWCMYVYIFFLEITIINVFILYYIYMWVSHTIHIYIYGTFVGFYHYQWEYRRNRIIFLSNMLISPKRLHQTASWLGNLRTIWLPEGRKVTLTLPWVRAWKICFHSKMAIFSVYGNWGMVISDFFSISLGLTISNIIYYIEFQIIRVRVKPQRPWI
jgi:hypothetical protein